MKRFGLIALCLALAALLAPGPAAAQMAHQVVIGTPGDDTQTTLGTPGRDFIVQYGLGANDTQYISGAAGDDWLEQNGGDGNDGLSIFAGSGNDFIHQDGGSGNDTLQAHGDDGNDCIFQFGGAGDDNLAAVGGWGNNYTYQSGGPGNDTMRVGPGIEDDLVRIDGGEGDDTITYDVETGQDLAYINGGPGYDRLTVNAREVNSFTLVDENGGLIYSQGTGGSYLIIQEVEELTVLGPDGITLFSAAPPVGGAPPADALLVHQVVTGTAGDDTLITQGTAERDFIVQYGLGGDDTMYISGADGDDWLEQNGGDGNDDMTIRAGDGNDFIHQDGGNGNDWLQAEGGMGNDYIFQFGGLGDDQLEARGGDGNDFIYQSGGPGNDTLRANGDVGDDLVRMDGGEGDDTLIYDVSDGQDTVYIDGGPGFDTLTVNHGDVFSYTLVNEYGEVLCQRGTGGTYIIVRQVEQITVLDAAENVICEWAVLAAGFTADPTEGFAPLTVQFTDASTGEITAWAWDFGDGGSSTAQNPSHLYKKAGSYQATLTVTGPQGTSSKSATINAYKKGAPKAKFSTDTKKGPAPLPVQFTDASTGWITGWAWDFGDPSSGTDNTSTEPSPSHTYNIPGKYKATLTVTGPGGATSKSATIKVTP